MDYSVLWKPRRLAAGLRRRLIHRRNMLHAIEAGKKRFAGDPNFRPDLVPTYFQTRPEDDQDDTTIIRRIVAAYQKAKNKQRDAGKAFNVSNEWLAIYERNLGPVMAALLAGDVAEVRRMYRNFFRDPCSTGLAGFPINIPNLFNGGHIKPRFRDYIMCDVLHHYYLWQARTGNQYPAAALSTPNVGNPYGYTMDGTFVRPCGDYQHYYSHAIGELLRTGANRVVLELGGGFGGLAYYLLRDIPGLSYVGFDLPEATALASYYLMKSLPDVNVRLYGEAEMSPSTVSVYLDEIARATDGYFLHVNHNRNAVLSADDFGVEKRGFKLLTREIAGWTLGINPSSDEYEYLYKAE